MADPRTVQRCHWAEPTLLLEHPSWTEAENYPWSCRADGDPRLVTDTTLCTTCGRWAPKGMKAMKCGCGGGCVTPGAE